MTYFLSASRRWATALLFPIAAVTTLVAADAIDRHALVTRHNPVITKIDPWAPLSVGNGRFAFTADVTGLQTFEDYYHQNGIPLETMARWAWHENANPNGYKLSDANRPFTAYGRTLGYPTNQSGPAGQWLRENPHDMPIGQLGFVDEKGAPLVMTDLSEIQQTLDLWSGELRSLFKWRGVAVEVSTVASPADDAIAVHVHSRAIADGKLRLRLAFPRGHDIKTKNNPPLDWSLPESHHTTKSAADADGQVTFQRERDAFHYTVALLATPGGETAGTANPHVFILRGKPGEETFEVSCAFHHEAPMDKAAGWAATKALAAENWESFWQNGGAIDFTGSRDPRAAELERRVVLSQYLTAIQFGGDFPPQESGLTDSSWYGKHHTEMIWWHTAHFALWGRDENLAKALAWFQRTLPAAREIAKERGLSGARWPKMVGPDGRESPGGNPLIVWNQPHVIHLAELLYRNHPTRETLALYRDLVFETADCMASMMHWDPAVPAAKDENGEPKGRFDLGPPLWIAQEIYDQSTSMNPTFELSYWARALEIAQEWKDRLDLERDPAWERIRRHLAPLPQKEGRYVALESTPDTWDNKDSRHDHPSFLMAMGMLPGDGVDPEIMGHTLDAVLATWDWEAKIWGWDYPMIAMTAARLNRPADAVDILLKNGPNNNYTANGHCPQRGDLPVYLPANGALLSAVAMMAAGWDGALMSHAPGFPHDGSWVVHSEDLHKLP